MLSNLNAYSRLHLIIVLLEALQQVILLSVVRRFRYDFLVVRLFRNQVAHSFHALQVDLVQVEESTFSEILKSLPPLQKFLVVDDERHGEEMLELVL